MWTDSGTIRGTLSGMLVASYLLSSVIVCAACALVVNAERRASRAAMDAFPQIAAALAAAQAQTVAALTEAAKAITAPYSDPPVADEESAKPFAWETVMDGVKLDLRDQRLIDDDSDQTDWLVPAPYTRPDAAVLGADMSGNVFGIPGLKPVHTGAN